MIYSIITINYNNKLGLENTIKSVVAQKYHDYEYIIIDGGSSDGSLDVIHEFSDSITYFVSEPDNGIYHAMNKGILKSHGEYLIFMNSGDCFYDNEVLDKIHPELTADIVEGYIYRQDKKTIEQRTYKTPTLRNFIEGSLNHQACFIKRTLFDNHLYDESLNICADWKFFLERIIFDNCTYTSCEICVARYEGNGISATSEIHEQERQKVLSQLIPERILSDYYRYYGIESPMIELIPRFNKTYRLHKFIISLVRFILNISGK